MSPQGNEAPMFAKPAADPRPAPRAARPGTDDATRAGALAELPYMGEYVRPGRWKRVAKGATMGLATAVVVALGAGAIWANNLTDAFDDGRNIINLANQNGNAQPDMSDLLKEPSSSGRTVAHQNPAPPPAEEDPVVVDGGLNVLLMGSDVRPEDDMTDSRTDTIMVAHISEEWDDVQIMSFPRDLWVQIPGYGEGRINSAFQRGGPNKVVETIQSLLDIEINHVAMIDFSGFSELTTALGGIKVHNPHAFTISHDNADTHFAEGEIVLQGVEALQYVRERKNLPESDLSRVQNQQRVVQASIAELVSAGTLSNPGKINNVLSTMLEYISVDADLTSSKILEYAMSARSLRPENITAFTIPDAGGFTTSAGAQVLAVDEAALQELQKAFDTGTVDEFAAARSG